MQNLTTDIRRTSVIGYRHYAVEYIGVGVVPCLDFAGAAVVAVRCWFYRFEEYEAFLPVRIFCAQSYEILFRGAYMRDKMA